MNGARPQVKAAPYRRQIITTTTEALFARYRTENSNHFDANLPGASQTVRIATFHDAKVFACRWAIRGKDPALKALLWHLKKANSVTTMDNAIRELQQALASHGLLITTSP